MYGLRRLQIGRCGSHHRKALLAPDCCLCCRPNGSGKGLATRQAGNVLLGGASGASRLLLNTKASQEAACSRAPAAIVPGPEPELHDAGVSRFSGNGSHLAEADAAEGHAGQVDGPGSSGNAENGSHLAATDTAESYARQVDSPGSSGNAGIGSHLEATDFSDEPGAVL